MKTPDAGATPAPAPTPTPAPRRKVPAAFVLASASLMVSIGIVAWLVTRPEDRAEQEAAAQAAEVRIETQSPESAAESFLDAWRKRRFDLGRQLSRGAARAAVDERASAAAGYPQEMLDLQRAWDVLADSRLHYVVSRSERLDPDRVQLDGVAQGEFVKKPYRRRVGFVCVREGGRWVVEEMHLGDILESAGAP